MKVTKAQAKANKAEWSKALAEGRVVRLNGGLTLKSFPTAEATLAFLVEAAKAGLVAEIVEVSKLMELGAAMAVKEAGK